MQQTPHPAPLSLAASGAGRPQVSQSQSDLLFFRSCQCAAHAVARTQSLEFGEHCKTAKPQLKHVQHMFENQQVLYMHQSQLNMMCCILSRAAGMTLPSWQVVQLLAVCRGLSTGQARLHQVGRGSVCPEGEGCQGAEGGPGSAGHRPPGDLRAHHRLQPQVLRLPAQCSVI